MEAVGSTEMPSPPRRETREREQLAAYGALQAGEAVEFLNERAVAVMKRMSDKLTGRDFVQVLIAVLYARGLKAQEFISTNDLIR